MRSIWNARHLDRNGRALWEDSGPNVFHDGGQEWLCKVASREAGGVPPTFYLGLDNRISPAESDTLQGLAAEPRGNGYARQAVNSDPADWAASQEPASSDWQGLCKTVTFKASGGVIGPVRQVFLATTNNNTGVLICTRPLSQVRTLADGESLECGLTMRRLLRAIPFGLVQKTRKDVPAPAEQATVAEGWEQYAKDYKPKAGERLGDEWTNPAEIGVDVPASQLLAYLDQTVFGPFLGNPEVILEIGAGGGRFTEILLAKCSKIIATDTSPTMVKLLKERFGDNPKVQCLVLDGLGLAPVPNISVDAAFSYGVFVHLQHWDFFHYLAELRRVLKPGGKAIIHHANTFSDLGWKKFCQDVRPSLNKHKLRGSFSVMTPEMMREFVQRAGLILEDCRTDVVRRDCISLIRKAGA